MPTMPRTGLRRPSEGVPDDVSACSLALAFSTTALGLLALPSAALAWGANSFSSASERELQALTNQARASAGRRSLAWDSTLASIARWRSKDMIERGYFSHDIPGVGKVFDVMTARGYCYRIAGENIGWNDYPDDVATAKIQAMFMASPGHRSNILGTAWDHIGIGAYKAASGKKMWTVLFADRCGGTTSKPKPAARPKPKPATATRSTPRPTARPTAAPTARPTPTPDPDARADRRPGTPGHDRTRWRRRDRRRRTDRRRGRRRERDRRPTRASGSSIRRPPAGCSRPSSSGVAGFLFGG